MAAEQVILDARQIPLIERHDRIFETFEGLKPGQAMVIINAYDPKPLHYQFMIEKSGQFA